MKRVLCMVLAVLLMAVVLAPAATVNAAGFKDVPASLWASDEINALAAKKVIAGYADGTFKPQANVSREEFAKMIVTAKGLTLVKPARATFSDVPSSRWSYGYVEAAAKAGYVSGIGGGKFGPTAAIKRQDLAVLLVRVLGKSSVASAIKSSVAFANDEDKIGAYAVGAVSIAVQPRVQVLKWDEDRNINPVKSATRADCAFAIYNTVNAVTSGKKTLTMAEENYPENLFPLISDSAYTMKAVTYLSSEPISMTPYGVLFPEMAKYVPTIANKHLIRNADGSVITDMELRPGMKWSDGQPVTIDDYIFSHQLYMSDDIQVVSRTPMDLVTKIVKVSDLKCRIYWKSWDPYIPAGWYIYPKHILGPQYTKDPKSINTSTFNNDPVYCGPYTLKTKVEGQYMTLAANKNWFGGQPVIENITMKAIDNNNTLLINMLTGQIDVSSESLAIDLAQQFESKMGKSFNVYYNKSTSAGILEWNLTSKWFKDSRVRQAFYYGIDRKLITQKAMVGTDAVLSPLSSGSIYYKPVLAEYAYSPDKANALLDAAGWKWNAAKTERVLPDGSPAVLKIPYSQGATFRIKEVTLIQPMLAKLGITVEHDGTDFNAMLDAATAGTFIINLHGISFSSYDAFGSVLAFRSDQIPTEKNGMQGQNNYRYSSADMDKWLNIAQNATTVTALKEAYSHVQDIFAKDLPCLYLEQRVYPDEVRKGLKGYDHFFSSTVYNNWNIQYWYWWK
ncbi:MAG TPA: ABC transporter substrate-binding protein [Clostridia bacterium]|nr:ABC transporter substrate-binding protein [Clostridia bacterium]